MTRVYIPPPMKPSNYDHAKAGTIFLIEMVAGISFIVGIPALIAVLAWLFGVPQS